MSGSKNGFLRPLLRLGSMTLALNFVLAGPVLAQEEDFGGDDEKKSSSKGSDAPETYTVKDGDTLWSLSAKFLNNPWYWPKIWSYNPQLDNPNWIAPGNVIRFYPGDDDGPRQAGGDPADDNSGRGDGDGDEEGGDGDDEDEYGADDIDIGDESDLLRAGFEAGNVAQMLADLANRRGVSARRQYFVPEQKLKDAGEIENAPTTKSMLSLYDAVWVDFKTAPEPGAVLQIFRPTKTISHPVTGFPLGTVVELVGEVRVDANSDGKSLATITAAWDTILRGDYVAELEEAQLRLIEPVPNDKELKGYVVDSAVYEGKTLSQSTLVFVDKGEKDGVKPGNTFTIVRAGDPLTGDERGLTDEVIGRMQVTDVRDNTSVGVLTYSNRAIARGDRMEMRVED